MRKGILSLMALTTAAALSLTACGDDGDDSGGDSGAAKGKVGVILPDTASSARWENFDRPYLQQAFKAAGVESDIQNAEGSAQRFQTIADQMLTSGVTVLLITGLDSNSAAAVQRKAQAQGVKTIDYDRLTLGGVADYYVSFDNVKVGETMGEGLKKCLGEKDANIVYLNGSPTDNNATLFAKGSHNVLDKVSTYKKVAEQPVPDWKAEKAATLFEQMWTEQKGKIDGVLAANDNLGNAVISILKKNQRAGKVPVTGQDATLQGLQNILDGTQCMSVYKPTKQEADAAVKLAVSLIKGEKGETTATEHDPVGKRDVPSVLLTPIGITKENVKQVTDDGAVKAADLCKGAYAAKCEAAGIKVQ
ncbi:sugar ABC transporter substrate-binding protein [Actinomadura madurae]|uniref:sugar ABC transporter substrate-binding protein n=1 Tax=Actinomadura madurae TaxID=1993 RepID=UPI0020265A90|nr:sugar ABC transporter substrate-binding protein [Actinomadura madurae]MCP9954500.1 sugar ABC transporter substrate-binding protein [Actinomadura madurae]MCP9971244.1 sugar ABC transporter substrate-binding protein [Actinomadura madurae]MCQ0004705.1 sugar ABC transporter substrate-binding protein [Actinomadura madurae]MCQ0019970.1 sugar ABC transporter substrate-binding protein [Actinomadura madurae]URM99996.1 sugar ABC transporter substrate-binding protein [Actinomadura madurae]